MAYIFDVSRFPPSTEYSKCNRLLSAHSFSYTLIEDISNSSSLEHTIISKSGGGQLDLLIFDTSFKVNTDHPYAFINLYVLCFKHSADVFRFFL